MLVLSRCVNETIVIGDNIKVTILDIKNGKVRLGIEADPSIPIHRLEVFERIKEERSEP